MGRIVETRELYFEKLKEITKDETSWQDFLKSASWNFKYDFDDQILIYAQRPNARACASMEEWNKKVRPRRWVNKGADFIFVQEKDENSQYPFRLVFDIADTHNSNNTEYKLWEIKQEYEQDIIETLESNFGEIDENNKNTLAESIITSSYNMVVDNLQDYMQDVIEHKKGSLLENMSNDDIQASVFATVFASVSYMVLTRCGIEPKEHLADSEFKYIKNFNNMETTTALGSAISDIAETQLREIAKTVFELQKKEKIKNRTIEKINQEMYSNNENQIEGGKENDENRIHEGWRLQQSKSSDGERRNTTGQIRKNEIHILEGTQESRANNISNEQGIKETLNRSAGSSNRESEPNSNRYGRETGNNGRIESEQPNALGTGNEQFETDSRGTSNERTNLRLSIYTPSDDAPGYVVTDSKINQILATTPYINKHSKEIIDFFEYEKDINSRANYIKSIFNIDYTEIVIDDTRYGYKTFENGVLFWKDAFLSRTAEELVKWEDLTKHFEAMILLNQLKEQYEKPKTVEDQMTLIEETKQEDGFDFEFTQEFIDRYLQEEGTEFKYGIYEYFNSSLSQKENIDYLKRIYGEGGSSHTVKGSGIGEWHNAKGITFSRGYIDKSAREQLFNWNYIEKRIATLIKEDRYLNSKELEEYPKWLEEKARQEEFKQSEERLAKQLEQEQNEKEIEFAKKVYKYVKLSDLYNSPDDANNLSTEESIIETIRADVDDDRNVRDYANKLKEIIDKMDSNNPDLQEAQEVYDILESRVPKYQYHLGDTVYIGADEYEIASINNDKVSLYDRKFPLLNKTMDFAEFERKVQENYANDHLKVKSDEAEVISESQVAEQQDIVEDTQKIEKAEIANKVNDEKTYKVGDIVYLEDDRRFQIDKIDLESEHISLLDLQLPIPIFRDESILSFEILYNQNEKNFPKKEEKQQGIADVVQNKEPQDEGIKSNIVKTKTKSKIQDFVLHPEVPESNRNNFKITDYDLGIGTLKEKYAKNIAAIKILKKCEEEDRYATPEEQKILSEYVGWGALQDAFDETKDNWANEYVELKQLLNEHEYEEAKNTTLTAFYTPPVVIEAMYKALQNMGLKEANILEPSCGVGNFFGMLPEELNNCKMYGVEIDSITGRIAQQLYQKSTIAVKGFEKVELPDSFFDVSIGNVPFADYKIYDKRYDKNRFLIHDYFFAKTLDKVRPGGVIAFITSKGTMDKKNPDVRKYIAQRAELIGAIRLPNNTFSKNAGTKVTSDIIFLKKREKMTDIMPDWVYLDKSNEEIEMNKYFVDNPQMILGNMKMETTAYGLDSTCEAYENVELKTLLDEAITNLHEEIEEYDYGDIEERDADVIQADPSVKNFSYCLVDGKVYFRENSVMVEQDLPITTLNRIKGMIQLRDCVRDLIDLQTQDFPDENIRAAQAKLNGLYDNFVKKYGLINSRGNSLAFAEDSSYYLLCSLEVLDSDGKFLRKADMFNKRTIKAYKEITSVDTANEALIVSLAEKAKIDFEFMEKLSGKSKEELIKELEGVIFRVPMGDGKYEPADEYLSGNVREKLKLAESLVETQPDLKVNIDALKEVIPTDLVATEIGVKLGSTWLPLPDIEKFIYELLETPEDKQEYIKVNYSKYNAEYYISCKNYDHSNVLVNKTYGTNRLNAYEIIERTLNLKDIKIFDTVRTADGEERVFNPKETAIAQAKQEEIRAKFDDWIWKDQERRERLVRLYNDKFNSIRPREYDGSHLNFAGINPEIKLRKHQENAIAHILYGRNTLLAHEVGAGKTFEMVAGAMESKRLGLCNKSLFVVPNHILEQFASEFLQLYPSANIMVATKKDFAMNNRKKFCSRIATGEFDAVIMGHSQFEKIPMSLERQIALLEDQLSGIMRSIEDAKRERAENFTVKQMVRMKKQLETKLEKVRENQKKKDDVVTFEELGVDKLFVDEAHNFKNLFLFTKMHNVGGIAQTEAQKSNDLFMKCRYLDEITDGRGTVFATGTPVSNSMVELYTMQRYLQYSDLEKMGLEHFDNWASTFGETVTAIELAPEGTGFRAKTRFAKFHNLPELMSVFKEVADIQTADTLNLPTPEVIRHNVVVKPSEMQEEMVKGLGERAEKIRKEKIDPKEDNMLKITNEGRKLALDQRLVNEMLEDFEGSKLSVASENIYKIWEENKAEKLTQLVFCDLSTPKQLEIARDEDGNYKFTDAYNDLKYKLIQKGVPPEEIAFIHEADSETKKKELFAKVRKGEVRVLIGSTNKMGAGTNVRATRL